jgi:DNA-binding CsgD family transcriptional regulator
MNHAARHLLGQLSGAESGLDDLLISPVRSGDVVRHEVEVGLVDGSGALLCARSTYTGSDDTVLVSFLELVTAAAFRGCRIQGLTKREEQVADLAARGLHDSEIAAQLHLSPYTVKQYLKAVYAKVGARSRVDLTRLLLQAGPDRFELQLQDRE